jgi:hypothetical protein
LPISKPLSSQVLAVASSGRAPRYRYTVDRMHSQSATEHAGSLAASSAWKRGTTVCDPWLSAVATTTAFSPRGKYQNRGRGPRSALIVRMRLARSRCCSSAWGIATFVRSTQSGWGSPSLAP